MGETVHWRGEKIEPQKGARDAKRKKTASLLSAVDAFLGRFMNFYFALFAPFCG